MRRGYDQSGASAVEFALILPLLVLFLFGIIQFGLTFGRLQGMEAAAREGGRLAAVSRTVTTQAVVDRVHDAAPPLLYQDPENDLVVTVLPEGDPGNPGQWCRDGASPRVRVDVSLSAAASQRYSLNIPLFGNPAANYTATAVFRCEANRTS